MALSADIVRMGGPRRRVAVTPQPTRDYHVLLPGVTSVAGQPVVDRGGHRIVRLTEAQAQYWIDQGALGEQPGESKIGAALGVRPQKPAEPARRVRPRQPATEIAGKQD